MIPKIWKQKEGSCKYKKYWFKFKIFFRSRHMALDRFYDRDRIHIPTLNYVYSDYGFLNWIWIACTWILMQADHLYHHSSHFIFPFSDLKLKKLCCVDMLVTSIRKYQNIKNKQRNSDNSISYKTKTIVFLTVLGKQTK